MGDSARLAQTRDCRLLIAGGDADLGAQTSNAIEQLAHHHRIGGRGVTDDGELRPEPAQKIEETKKEQQLRSGYEKDVVHLAESIVLYQRVKNTLQPENAENFASELKIYKESIPSGLAAIQKTEAGQEGDKEDLQVIVKFFHRYQALSQFAYALVVPPLDPSKNGDGWKNIGASLMESLRSGAIHPALDYLAAITSASRAGDAPGFNKAVSEYRDWLAGKGLVPELNKGVREAYFNHVEFFYKSMIVYVAAMLLGCAFWINFSEPLRRAALYILALGFVFHTFGLGFRMFLEGRPPVTNLYSSAVFIGWGTVLLGLILERVYHGAIGVVVAGFIGFVTLIIAHHLSLGGDTMQMLQAVLDTNIWLATHVVVVTTGYASMFVAGLLAIVYILRGLLTKPLTEPVAKALTRMVYGIICFATLFSFTGTILGGIWADQSWGRFWGWDPKENGALLIVLWCAITLHARWGGLVKERGLMALAIFGNIVTSFSWFGVNMLNVGLHSYGFMDKAFNWLMAFVVSQVVLIVLAMLPERYWRSFRGQARQTASRKREEPLAGGEAAASAGA